MGENIAEELAILISRAEKLGFRWIDLYNEDDELIAFTCSRSEEYIHQVQNIGKREAEGL